MPAPGDSATVLSALRLGWYVAEVRGRNRPDGPRPAADQLPSRQDHVLPLHFERTDAELRIEAQAVLSKLAGDLGVDMVTVNGQRQNQATVIDEQARALAQAAAGSQAAADAWDALSSSMYDFDAHTQDTLTAQSDMCYAAYQLGRGLAEVFWALDPAAACDPLTPDCWEFLLGEHRCRELTRLAGRLSAYFNPYCCPAIAGTISLWQSVASDQQWRQGAQTDLFQQLRRWYELLILGQDPSTLIKPYALVKNWRTSLRVLQALWVQLVTTVISLALVVAVITLVADDSGTPFVKSLLGVLGAVGLSTAAFQTRLKATAQGLLTRFRQDAYTDLVAGEIAVAPDKPGASRPDKAAAAEIGKRTLTTVADADAPPP
jgi:hypothetical protein